MLQSSSVMSKQIKLRIYIYIDSNCLTAVAKALEQMKKLDKVGDQGASGVQYKDGYQAELGNGIYLTHVTTSKGKSIHFK